ncbi:hypothetical protein HN873_063436, partial [Arachis hypogaea]
AALLVTLSITIVSTIFILSSALPKIAALCPKSTLTAAAFPVHIPDHQDIVFPLLIKHSTCLIFVAGSLNTLPAKSTPHVGALESEIDLLSPHCAITHSMSATPLSSHERHLSPLKYECKMFSYPIGGLPSLAFHSRA